MQSAAEVDPTANSHWSSQEWLVTGAQSGEPNFHWLMSAAVGWVGSAVGVAG